MTLNCSDQNKLFSKNVKTKNKKQSLFFFSFVFYIFDNIKLLEEQIEVRFISVKTMNKLLEADLKKNRRNIGHLA